MIEFTEQVSTTLAPAVILVVEDNDAYAATLCASLETEGYVVHRVGDGEAALRWLAQERVDLIVLDLMLPHLSGFEVLRRYRALNGGAAVLILSAKDEEVDKVQGFRIGADDYVAKPTGLLELLARVEAMLRRVGVRERAQLLTPAQPQYRFADIVVDTRTRRVTRDGVAVDLTPMEFELLIHLIRRQESVVPRDELLHHVWHYSRGLTSRTVDQHIARLRFKLEADPAAPRHFLTVRKAGYRFEP